MAHDEDKSRDIMVAPSGYNFYADVSSSGNQNIIPTQFMTNHLPPPQQSFEPTTAAVEIYNLTAGMEMIGFPSKNSTTENPVFWKGFFSAKPGNNGGAGPSSSSSKEINDGADHFFHQNSIQQNHSDAMTHQNLWNIHQHQQNRFLDDDGENEGDQSLSCSVFPCEGNERPSQGLSLSLSSSNPSTIGLQSFQLRQQHQHQSEVMHHQSHAVITNSKYLTPAQELLNEFCSLQTTEFDRNNSKMKAPKTSEWLDENAIKTQPLYSLDLLELQRRKTKLLQMLEEVDRRYRHYCDQMKAVISSFETTAGKGAAGVYSSLASRAMSRHFRCLRDGIVSQIRSTKKAMGDKDIAAPGTVKGETPRLRLLDQTIRQQRAIQQMSFMESHPWRPQRGLPERSVSVLRAWLFEHFLHPYPSDVDKHILARQTGLSRSQVSNWFINARVRLWKPMVEEMYLEELKEDEGGGGAAANLHENEGMQQISTTQNNNHSRNEDLKPTHDQLVRIDSECLSSIINNNTNPEKNEAKRSKGAAVSLQNEHQHQIINPSFGETYGAAAMELDFSSYGHHSSGGGGGVSLTLGLHQNSLFYGRSDNMDDVQTAVSHQYSFLDSENQNLPYRNLMGAQLLRDLAG